MSTSWLRAIFFWYLSHGVCYVVWVFSVVYRKLQMSCLTYFISMHEYRLISWTNFLNRWTATWVVQLQIKQTYGNWKIYYRVKKVKMEPIYLIVNSFWRINKMKESIISRHNSIVLTWDDLPILFVMFIIIFHPIV